MNKYYMQYFFCNSNSIILHLFSCILETRDTILVKSLLIMALYFFFFVSNYNPSKLFNIMMFMYKQLFKRIT